MAHVCDMEKIPHENCRECPLYKVGEYVPPTENWLAPYLLVGGTPVKEDVRKARPFSGGSAWHMFQLAEQLGMGRDDFQVANIVRCRVPSYPFKASKAAVQACAPLLDETLSKSRAKAVGAVGQPALERLIGQDTVRTVAEKGGQKACWDLYVYRPGHEIPDEIVLGKKRGRYGDVMEKGKNKGLRRIVTVDDRRPALVPPTARGIVGIKDPYDTIAQGWAEFPLVGTGLLRLQELGEGHRVYDGPHGYFTSVDEFIQAFLAHGKGGGPRYVAFDIENKMDGTITDISFADSRGLVASFRWSAEAARAVDVVLRQGDWVRLAHNATHDVFHLLDAGHPIPTENIHDTMVMSQLDEPDMRKGLGHVAPRFLLMVPWKHMIHGDMSFYNAMDSDVTRRIYPELRDCLRQDGAWNLFTKTQMPATFKLKEFTRRGIKVDPGHMHQWETALAVERDGLSARLVELQRGLGLTGLDPTKSGDLGTICWERLGLRPLKTSRKTGKPSLDKDTLTKFALKAKDENVAQFFHTLLQLRKTSKLLNTYTESLKIHDDGCVHPEYLPGNKDAGDFGAASGRLSARNPNIQNQPHVARYMYVPHRPGMVFWARDYSQIEARIVALLAGDQDLLEAYEQGRDRHQETADFLTEQLGREITRREAKAYRHGLNYGMGAPLLAEHTGISIALAERIVAAFKALEPKVFQWQKNVADEAVRTGIIVNAFGRHRRFPGFADNKRKHKHYRNAAINIKPQSLVADITLEPMQELDDALLAIEPAEYPLDAGACVLTQVHDEFMGQCLATLVEKTEEVTRRVMERVYDNIAPGWYCPTSFTVGHNWAACKDNEEAAKKLGITPVEYWRQQGCPTS